MIRWHHVWRQFLFGESHLIILNWGLISGYLPKLSARGLSSNRTIKTFVASSRHWQSYSTFGFESMLIQEWVCLDKDHISALLSSSIHSWKITFDSTNVLIQLGVVFGKSGGSQSPASRPLSLYLKHLDFLGEILKTVFLSRMSPLVTKWLIATGRPCSYHCKGSASAGEQGGPISESSHLAQTESLALWFAKKKSGNGITFFLSRTNMQLTWFVKEICEGERKFTVHLWGLGACSEMMDENVIFRNAVQAQVTFFHCLGTWRKRRNREPHMRSDLTKKDSVT